MDEQAATALEHPAAGKPEDPKPRRKKQGWWDRSTFLILLAGLWLFMLWAKLDEIPPMGTEDAARGTLRSKWWILALGGLQLQRQVLYFNSEHWSGWHRFWPDSLFGRLARRTGRLTDWIRYRMARV